MAYAITQTCCNDASCVSVCPVNCIHPTPGEPDFGSTEMLYIDPRTCIDCGACADACPVDAVFPVDRLRGPDTVYAELNRQYYDGGTVDQAWGEPHFPPSVPHEVGELRIAVVGSGPAASYTAQSVLRTTGAEVTMIERLPVPGGLVRFGVAPDHPSTKKIGEGFAGLFQNPRLRTHLNVEVGTDLTHDEVAAHHHAVVYAVGAATDRALGVPGEDMTGSVSATSFVAWYNAHPDVAATEIDLSAERVVVVGNGNVALDVARILLTDPERLAHTDIADHALAALRASNVREVVLLARRGPEHAAYTRPEFLGMQNLDDVRIVVDEHAQVRRTIATAEPGSHAGLLDGVPIEQVDWTAPPPRGKRLVLRFLASPVELLGDDHVRSVRLGTTPAEDDPAYSTGGDTVRTELVVRAIGHRSTPVDGLPFDAETATVPSRDGRVIDPDTGEHLAATYVVGWLKRGPSGGIGANKRCAENTVEAVLADAASHRLPPPTGTRRQFERLVRRRKPEALGQREMRAIDRAERGRGQRTGRPRVKFATTPELLEAAKRKR